MPLLQREIGPDREPERQTADFVPSPFEDTGLWGAQAFWYEDHVRIEGGLLGWKCAELLFAALLSGVHPFLASLPPECYGWNKNVYEWRP